MTIKEVIRELSGIKDEEIYSQKCKVISVDKATRTCICQPLNGDADIIDVMLQSNINQNTGLVVFPKDGSDVIVTFISKEIAFVSLVVDIDEIIIDTPQIVINGGTKGGIPVAANISQRLNILEQRMAVHQHLYISPAGPPPVPTIIDPTSNPALSLTQASQLENNKVTHG